MILVTGAKGSIGSALLPRLERPALGVDIEDFDIRDVDAVRHYVKTVKPDLIYHLAGAKSATQGEADPLTALQVNAVGTANILAAAGDAHVITVSTCKACDPETAYGASKLLAERLTLEAGG